MKRIAFLGPEGTVSQESSLCFLGDKEYEFVSYPQMYDVFTATVNGETDFSVIPIENAIDGSVSLHVDLLVNEFSLPILAEWVYPSIQNLIGYKQDLLPESTGNPYAGISKIYSIPVATSQCYKFLRANIPGVQSEGVSSTAKGVQIVKERGESEGPGGFAAIGTRLAAKLHGLDILAENITDHQNNYTRFVLVGSQTPALRPSDKLKTTIVVTLPEDFPGALHQVLSAFAWRRINLSKIESRPTKLKLGSYYFYIDVEGSLDSVLLPAAIAEIEALGCQVRALGSYPCYDYDTIKAEA
ncbi:prephenate dehydratase [Paenibacillus contaminans]|uniref:Prephenate dehydratase n=1 Tax=Paenibacillus contaminans TaxID=450362 RepID=A0A329MPY7_9BACL|nr:prephenate dehydratase [Paenibacillus contaminans]RAV21955.1 prephenate dehydratase [Paenibacillus contaminans]